MSREQGPREGDATVRDCRRTPTVARRSCENGDGGGGMSREQGPRKGMRPSAIAAGRRQELFMSCGSGTEAAA